MYIERTITNTFYKVDVSSGMERKDYIYLQSIWFDAHGILENVIIKVKNDFRDKDLYLNKTFLFKDVKQTHSPYFYKAKEFKEVKPNNDGVVLLKIKDSNE